MFWSISACHVEAGSTEEKSVFVCVGLWLFENRIVMLQGRKRITLTSSDVVQMEKNTKKAKKKSPRKQRQEKGRNEGKK